MPKSVKIVIASAATLVILLVGWFVVVEIKTVHGNEVGVLETWNGGVDARVFPAKTYVLFPGFSKTMYRYDLSPHVYVMNDRKDDERAHGRPQDAFVAKSSDNQSMTMWLALQWHYDQARVVDIHKRYRTHADMKDWEDSIEERLIRQSLIQAVNVEATKHKAIDAYSGDGFVRLQADIAEHLQSKEGELRDQGIVVETFIIERISLADDYIGEINKRQVAQQRELRAQQEEKAALAEAQKVKAEAQSDYEKQIVEARREKEKVVLASEAQAQQQVNEAKGQAEKVVLAANAEKASGEARGAAIRAIGEAEAAAIRAKLSAYAEPGAAMFTRVEVAKQMAVAFANIKGYLPEKMDVYLLSSQFEQALDSLMGQKPKP